MTETRHRNSPQAVRLVLVGFSDPAALAVETALAGDFDVTRAGDASELDFTGGGPRVVAIDGGGETPAAMTAAVAATLAETTTLGLAIALGGLCDEARRALADAPLFYRSEVGLPAQELVTLLAAAGRRLSSEAASKEQHLEDYELALRLTQPLTRDGGLERLTDALASSLRTLLKAPQVEIWVHDEREDRLGTRHRNVQEHDQQVAGQGLLGFVQRTGTTLRLEHAGDDPRYRHAVDAGEGEEKHRLLAVPLVVGARGAALVASIRRPPEAPAFSDRDLQRLGLFTELAEAPLRRRILSDRYEDLAARSSGFLSDEVIELFRPAALKSHVSGDSGSPRLVQLSQGWISWTYWLVLAFFLAAALFLVFATTQEFAFGKGVVVIDDGQAGSVEAVIVMPGSYRPLIRPGMTATFRVDGFRRSQEPIALDRISPRILAPAEARSELGSDRAELFDLEQPVFIAYGRLSGRGFDDDGQKLPFYDGMTGTVQVMVSSERLLFTVFPVFRNLPGGGHG